MFRLSLFGFRNAACLNLIVAILVLGAVPVEARPPEIRAITVRGLQLGASTNVIIDGADLLPAPQVFLNDLPLSATVDPASTPARLVLSIATPDAIPPGVGCLRLVTAEGFSNSIFVGLDRLPNLPLAVETLNLPVALHGSVPGSGSSQTSFLAKAGEEYSIEVEARRLGSKLRPVVHVYDERRFQVSLGLPRLTLGGDTRITFRPTKEGRYTVELHDTQYAPPGPSFFRLKIGQWQYVDLAFPPVIAKGQETSIELLGNVGNRKLPVSPVDGAEFLAIPFPDVLQSSGFTPRLMVSSLPELVHTSTDDRPLALPGYPVAVSGRLMVAGQASRFQLPVSAGAKISFEVYAERIGSRVDSLIELRNATGAVLATNDDGSNTTDSRLEFVVPAATDTLEVQVRDTLELAHPEALYRLVILPTDVPKNNFTATVKSDVVNLAAGETQVFEVLVNREGYAGPLQCRLTGLPQGVSLSGTDIPPRANGTLVTFTAGAEAAPGVVTQVVVQTPDGLMSRIATTQATSDDRTPIWLRDQLAVSAIPKPASPFSIAWASPEALPHLRLASKNAVALNLTRPAAVFGPVRLSFVTSQPVPNINGQPNPALSVRVEQLVEVPVDPAVKVAGDALVAIEKQIGDATKAVQIAQGDAKVAADAKLQELLKQKVTAEQALRDAEAKGRYGAQLSLVVPATLNESICDLAVKAELLNPERNQVLRTTYTPVRRLEIQNPLLIKLSGSGPLEAKIDPKVATSIPVTGSVERLSGYTGPVSLSLTGLPAGVTAANVNLTAEQSEFKFDLKLPANFNMPELKNLKLTATGPADPLSGNIPVKSAEVELTVKVVSSA